jgi:uncharacterized membrane protein
LFKKTRHYFVSGLISLAPLFFTILVIGYLVKLVDAFVVNPVFRLLPLDLDLQSKIILAKAIIALVVLLFVTVLGFAAERFIFRKLIESGESVFTGIPVFNKLYASFKEIAQAFFGDKSGIFKRVVCVEYPRKGVYALGFVTQDKPWELSARTGKDLVSVFLPHPPNPAGGFLVFVPKEELVELEISVEEALRLVISGGAAAPGLKK